MKGALKMRMRLKRAFAGSLAALWLLVVSPIGIPRARAAVVELGASAIISGLVAYLAASGITYAADGGTVQDIIDSIGTQIEPWAVDEYGSLEGFYGDVRSLSSPLGILNGSLSISGGLSAIYDSIRTWLIDNAFSSSSDIVVDRIQGTAGTAYNIIYNGNILGAGDVLTGLSCKDAISYWRGGSTWDSIISHSVLIDFTDMDKTNTYDLYFTVLPSSTYVHLIFRYVNQAAWTVYASGRSVFSASAANGFSYCRICLLDSIYDSSGSLISDSFGIAINFYSNPNFYNATNNDSVPFFTYAVPGSIETITTPSYMLTSDYDSSVSAPVVADGEALTVSTDTTMIQGLDAKLDAVLAAVQAGAGALQSSVDALPANLAPAVYQPGSSYALDLTDMFPFCIPFDLYRGSRLLVAEPEAPRFVWDVPLPLGDTYELVIDLSVFDGVAAIARKMELLAFLIGLAVMTKKIIKW